MKIKKYLKKVLCLSLVAIIALFAVGCSSNSSKDKNDGGNSSSTEQSEKSITTEKSKEMDISEFDFYTDSDNKTCSILRGDEEPKHEIMKIPNEYDGHTVVEVYDEGFKLVGKVNKLVIPDTVKRIGSGAFEFCPDLETVEMGNGVEELGSDAFIGCKKLKTVTLSNKLTEMPMGAFQQCAIETITIPSSVQSIEENAFALCESLKEVHITESVKEIADTNGPFEGCPNVTIYAPSGSYAEKYAKSKNIPFVAE